MKKVKTFVMFVWLGTVVIRVVCLLPNGRVERSQFHPGR